MAERLTRAQVERKAAWLNDKFGFDFNVRNSSGWLVIESDNEQTHNIGGTARDCLNFLMDIQFACEKVQHWLRISAPITPDELSAYDRATVAKTGACPVCGDAPGGIPCPRCTPLS